MRSLPWILACTLLGCTSAEPAELVVFTLQDGVYDIGPRPIAWLTDAQRLDGELGTGKRGGQLVVNSYVGGGPLDIPYTVDGAGTAWPADEDGLVLWSFYAHLGDVREELDAAGYEMDPLFPVGIAHTPSQALLDFSSFENAAYVTGGAHLFVLLKDLIDKEVPLAANAGIVRHEFGHAWFQLLTTGSPTAEPAYDLTDTVTANSVRALNEGFADMVATLTLDSPAFIEASLPIPERDVRLDTHIADSSMYPVDDGSALGVLDYDPYALGSVYAAVAWDLREATDPDTALAAVAATAEDWGARSGWTERDSFLWMLAENLQDDPVALEAVCTSVAWRFPDNSDIGVCL